MKLDKWVRWSYRVNGWLWSVMCGARVVAEGFEATFDEANAAADSAEVAS